MTTPINNSGVLIVNQTGDIVQASAAAATIFGYRPAHLQRQNINVLIPDAAKEQLNNTDLSQYLDKLQSRLMAPGKTITGRRKDGSQIAIAVDLNPLQSGDEQLIIVVITDLTQYIQFKKTLEEKNSRYFTLLNNAPNAIISINSRQTIVYWNKAAIDIFGYSATEILGQPLKTILPEPLLKQYLQTMLHTPCNPTNITENTGGSGASSDGNSIETVGHSKDGYTLRLSLSLATWQIEEICFCTFIVTDITRSSQAKLEVRKWSNALAQIADSVVITNQQGIIEYVNPAFERLTGYSKQEAVGLTPRILKSGKHTDRFYKQLWQTLHQGQTFQATFVNRRKNGNLFYEDRVIAPLKDENGYITHFISTGRDITDRKNAQSMITELATQMALINKIGNQIVSLLEPDRLLQKTARLIHQQLKYDHVALLLIEGKQLKVKGIAGIYQDSYPPGYTCPVTYGLTGWVARHGQKLVANDVNHHPQYRPILTQSDTTKSELCLPIVVANKILGVIDIQSPHLNAFSRHNVMAMEALSNQLAAALENARLYTQTRRYSQDLSTINKLGREIVASLDLNTVLQQIVDGVKWMLSATEAFALLYHSNKNSLRIAAAAGPNTQPVVGQKISLDTSIGAALVWENNQPILIEDVTQDPRLPAKSQTFTGHALQSLLVLPLVIEDNTIGFVKAANKANGLFTLYDLELLELLGNSAAAAVKNAQLHAETQRYLQELAFLNQACHKLATSLDLNEVLTQVLQELEQIVAYDSAVVMLLKDDELQLAVSRNFSTSESAIGLTIPLDKMPLARKTLQEGQPVVIADTQQEPLFKPYTPDSTRTRSLIDIPLIAGQETVGILSIDSWTPQQYSQADSVAVFRFAQYAALFIANARLFQKTRQENIRRRQAEEALRQANTEIEMKIQSRTTELARVNKELQAEIRERKRTEAQLQKIALHDSLTKLPNRGLFMQSLQQVAERQQTNHNYMFALLFIDLDYFKNINDKLGHQAGDRLLIIVARRLLQCVRSSDTVARMGGDEFAVLLDDIEDIGDAQKVARCIQRSLSQPVTLEGYEVQPTASIGLIDSKEKNYRNPADLLRKADMAMYQAKHNGRARYQMFDEDKYAQEVALKTIENELGQALQRQEFVIHYQPIISLNSGQMTAVEALLRWQHPHHGLVEAYEFIGLLQETGLILSVGEWVLQTACHQVAQWQQQREDKSLRLSVNISAKQLWHQNMPTIVNTAMTEAGLPTQTLELEISEDVIAQNTDETIKTLRALRTLGVKLAINNFGLKSTLNLLKQLPLNTLKIESSLIKNMTHDSCDIAIVNAIISMAQILGLNVIAEGVEQSDHLAFLQQANCNEAQGHLFSQAVPPEKISDMLQAPTTEMIKN